MIGGRLTFPDGELAIGRAAVALVPYKLAKMDNIIQNPPMNVDMAVIYDMGKLDVIISHLMTI